MDRRNFLKLTGAASISSLALKDLLGLKLPAVNASDLTSDKYENYKIGTRIPSICPYCAGGCGLLVTTLNGAIVEVEGDPNHPINRGAVCSKAAAAFQLYTRPLSELPLEPGKRIQYPLRRTNPNKGLDENPGWERITWAQAYDLIAAKVKDALTGFPYQQGDDYYYNGKDNPIAWLGSSYWNNEECYLGRKLISLLGSNNVEHQARKCHASTVAALGSTFGFGAMTNHIIDAKNSKCFLIMSNPVESHTMEFKWVTDAIDAGATVIVMDPRFTRTAAKAHIYSRYRSGSEAAIFLGLIRYVLNVAPERVDTDFLEARTNAPYSTDGTFLADWQTNPDSIFSKLKALVDTYTPQEVERISGVAAAKLIEIADTFSSLKPANIYYSMGTTQHTNATQAIRAHAILQLILGNMGKPGGGVNALRGISNVQGSTDMNLLSHLLMGYRAPPVSTDQLRRYQKWKNTAASTRGGVDGGTTYPWGSLAEAEAAGKVIEYRYDARHLPTWNALEYHWGLYAGTWPGDDPDNEPVVCDLPVVKGHPIVQMFRAIKDGTIKVLLCNGENPAVSVANANFVREEALASPNLFTVVYELFETETAHYADLLLPGTVQIERAGSITNTGRWIQWRWKAVDPQGECKPELTYLTELYEHIRASLTANGILMPSEHFEADNSVEIKRTIGTAEVENDPEATWPSTFTNKSDPNYATDTDALAEAVFKETAAKSIEVGGVNIAQAPANILYRKGYDPDADPEILAKRRDPTPADAEDAMYGYYKNWAYSWMDNQRILYNIDESNPGLKSFFVWFAMTPTKWIGIDRAAIWSKALFDPSKPVTHPWRHAMPLHNEAVESPDPSLAAEYPTMWDDRFAVDVGDADDYPYVLTTNRLAEHMQAGALTRNLPWLVETHPEVFVEMSPILAETLGVTDGSEVLVKTARNPDGVRVKALVTNRMQPLLVNDKVVHQVAMPWHWGFKGLSTGASANELTMDAVDVSAQIPETKTCLCNVVKP
jgi:formate dehydrogenase major subunit